MHQPSIERFRGSLGRVPGAPEPSDAALKYSGVLGRAGTARWTAPALNRRDLAEVWVAGSPPALTLGETTLVINGRQIGPRSTEGDVIDAIGVPPISSRTEGRRTRCWFAHGVTAVGHTIMDVATPGPWTHVVSKPDAASRLARTIPGQARPNVLRPCRTGTGSVTVRVTGFRGDAALEEYIRRGEAEHNADLRQSFERNVGQYVANVNALVGGRPELELSATDESECRLRLLRLANPGGLARRFILDQNVAKRRRHTGGRHTPHVDTLTVDPDCSRATVTLRHATL